MHDLFRDRAEHQAIEARSSVGGDNDHLVLRREIAENLGWIALFDPGKTAYSRRKL